MPTLLVGSSASLNHDNNAPRGPLEAGHHSAGLFPLASGWHRGGWQVENLAGLQSLASSETTA